MATVIVVTAKPGRAAWAAEEALDTLIPLDPDASIRETGYPGVFIIVTLLSPAEAARAYSRHEHAFISTIIPAVFEVGREEVLRERLALLLRSITVAARSVCLLVRLRGESKRTVDPESVEKVILHAGLKVSRRSDYCVAVEGIGSKVYLSAGRRLSCGPSCLLVAPPHG